MHIKNDMCDLGYVFFMFFWHVCDQYQESYSSSNKTLTSSVILLLCYYARFSYDHHEFPMFARYLHSQIPTIVHRDLKSLNVVLDLSLNIKASRADPLMNLMIKVRIE